MPRRPGREKKRKQKSPANSDFYPFSPEIFLSCFFAPRGPPEGGDFNRFLSGHAPDKKHFSPCKCASWPPKADSECARQGAKNRSRSRNDFENEGKKLPPVARGKIPLMPCRPMNNLHKRAGGSPKLCFTASNVRPGREACNPQIQIGIPYERCGFNGPSCRKGQTRTPQNFVFFSFYAAAAALILPLRQRAGP